MKWIFNTGQKVTTVEGKVVDIWHLQHTIDPDILSSWAKHFRNHYCLDEEIDAMRSGTKLSREEYLINIKFPDVSIKPGPSIRAGDFGEILVADYLEYVLNYWVPRTRYLNKAVRNESTKGSDLIGFKLVSEERDGPNDVLAVYEVKTQFSGNTAKPRLQNAVKGSAIDHIRLAETLNAMKQKFLDKKQFVELSKVERFQSIEDRPYKEQYGAVALFSSQCLNADVIAATTTSEHPNDSKLSLLVIHGDQLMLLVHELYRRAANEA